MQNTALGNMTGKKKAISRLSLVFLILMLGLTFFSNTINNLSLPKVNYESISGGSLVRQVSGTGNVEAVKTSEFYTDTPLVVLNRPVKVGDTVKKGQLLFRLDTAGIADSLADAKALLEQKQLALGKLKAAAERNGNSSYDNTVANAEAAVETARQNYNTARDLYDAGGETEQNRNNAKASLDKAVRELQQAEADRETARRNNSSEIRSMELDIQIQQRKVAKLELQRNLSEIKAPSDGTITELNFEEGTTANNSQPLYQLAESSEGFVFLAVVDIESAGFLAEGDPVTVTIDAFDGKALQGSVAEIKDNDRNRGAKKDVRISISSEGLIGGESGDFSITKNSGFYKTLIPNSAVGQDNSGYFVYVVGEKRGPLGNEHYVHRANVTVGDNDPFRTVITSGLNIRDRVVTSSDKTISDGSRVMLSE